MARRSPEDMAEVVGGQATLELGPLTDALGFHIRMAQTASFRGFQRSAGMNWLKPGWFTVLSLINDNPDITAVELGRATGRDKSTMTPLLRALEGRGLIARLGVPEDRRRHALRLTGAGAVALAQLAVHARQHEDSLKSLAGADKAVVIRFLQRVMARYD